MAPRERSSNHEGDDDERRQGSPRPVEVHGLGRHRRGLDDRGGHPAVPADRAGRFVGLVNVVDLKPGGMGRLGDEQLD
jgi:hypothetical protein